MKSISCKEAVNSILKKEEGKLSLVGHFRLWQHLMICSLCRVFADQNKMINKLVSQKKSAGQQRLTEDEKEGIIRNVLEKDK